MQDNKVPNELATAVAELHTFRETLVTKSIDILEEDKLMTLLDSTIKKANERSQDDPDLKSFGDATWGVAYAIVLNFPTSLTWQLALRLALSFSWVSKEPPSPQPLLGMEAIREATIASETQPLIPKAFATLLIAMVAQHYITVDDLEGHSLALLHFDWLKEELIFIEKCLMEIKSMLAEKLVSEVEIQLMVDWIAETVRAMVADMDP